jgi:hypothetical protein
VESELFKLDRTRHYKFYSTFSINHQWRDAFSFYLNHPDYSIGRWFLLIYWSQVGLGQAASWQMRRINATA